MPTFGRKVKLTPDQEEIAQHIMASSVAHYESAIILSQRRLAIKENSPAKILLFTLI